MYFKYFAKRTGFALFTLFLASIMTFLILRAMPGDIVEMMSRTEAQNRGINLEDARKIVANMINYDPTEPLPIQLGRYYGGLLKGNLGVSMFSRTLTVNTIIANTLPWTMFVLSISLAVSFFIGTRLGTLMAWKRDSFINPVISIYAIITTAIPNFIFGVLLILVFCINLNWFPISGAHSPEVKPGFTLEFIVNIFYHGALPMLTYILTTIGSWALQMKGASVSVLGEDYITAARARGVPDNLIMKKYMKKNAMLPMVTALAMSFGMMVGGSTLIESTFSYPGMGKFISQATAQRDYTMMQGLLLATSFAIIVANLIADFVYAKLDPRVRLEG
jgi:peptide/nickel transport system permease protein